MWVDRKGQESPIPAPARAYIEPRLSPDGRRIAVAIADQENDSGVERGQFECENRQRVVSVSDSVSNDWFGPLLNAREAKRHEKSGEPRWNRTINPQIKSLLLCQLS